MIGWLICAIKGHKRGVRGTTDGTGKSAAFMCPRCGAMWTRKVKPAKAAA